MTAQTDPDGVVTITEENGAQVYFIPLGAGSYAAPAWMFATLVKNGDGTLSFTRRKQTTFTFSPTGSLIRISDRNGYATTLAYNASGQLTTVTDAAGRSLSVGWGANGMVASVSDGGGRSVSYGYDTSLNLTTVTDVGGGVTSLGYDSGHRVLTMTDPRAGTVTNVYDPSGRVTRQTDPLSRPTTFDFTSTAGSTRITSPNGNVEVQTYDAATRQLTAITRGVGTAQAATSTYAYDGATNALASKTDPNHHLSTQTHDAQDNLTSVTDALSRRSSFTYDAATNDLMSSTDPKLVTTTFTHDSRGNLTSASTPLSGTSQNRVVAFTYADAAHPGDVTSMTDANAKLWTFVYDAAGNLTRAIDPLGNATAYGYDAIGRRTSMVSPRGTQAGVTAGCTPPALGCSTFTYNAFGDLLTTTDALGHQASRHYDGDRNVDSATDADGHTTTSTFDAANQLTQIRRPDSTNLAYDHDADGNVTAQRDGANQATRYAYDALDRVATSTDPNARTTTYGFDPAGNLSTRQAPGGNCAATPRVSCVTYAYDVADELTSLTYSDGTTPNVSAIAYDADGHRTSMTDGTGTSTWTWDSLGRMTQSVDGAGANVGYGYDLMGQLTNLTYPNNQVVTRTYDDAGRLSSMRDWLGRTTTFSHDADANHTATASPNDTSTTTGFDAADRAVSVAHARSGANFASFAYTRDNAGQLASSASTGMGQPNEAYTYTALNQLKTVNAASYDHDAADNLTALAPGTTIGYDAANQATSLTQGGANSTLAYDTRGNRLSSPASGPATTYDYDQASRLTGVRGLTAVAAGSYHSLAAKSDGTVLSWGYNGEGEVGDGTTTQRLSPVVVGGLSGVARVAAGYAHSLAAKSDGTVWAWGYNGDGGLGDGTTTTRLAPVKVIGLTNVAGVAGGGYTSLAVKSDGTVWAWGNNAYGQLGNGSTTSTSTPVQVSGLSGVVAVAAGTDHSLAVKSDGTVWAWGYNAYGQLGNGSTTSTSTPVQVAGLSGVVAVAGGAYHSLAVKSDGTVWAWGYGGDGELGNGATVSRATPVQVAGLTGAVSTAGGAYHSMASKSDGTVWAWGKNGEGELGDGTVTSRSVPVRVSGLSDAGALAAGAYHSLAIKSHATAWAWGTNTFGGLGDGTTTNRSSPVAGAAATALTYAYDGDGLRSSKTLNGLSTHFVWDHSGAVPQLLYDGARSYLYGPDGTPVEHIADPVSLVGTGSASDLGASASLSIALPGGIAAGDTILVASTQQNDAGVATPSGYSVVGSYGSRPPTPKAKTVLFARTASGGESNVALSYTGSLPKAAVAAVYRGADPVIPIEATSEDSAFASTATVASLTTGRAGERLVIFQGAIDNARPATWSAPPAMVERTQSTVPLVAVGVADQVLPSAGDTGSRTATLDTPAQIIGLMVALRPPPDAVYYHQDQLGSTRVLTDGTGAVVGTFTYDAYGKPTSSSGTTTTPLGYAGQYTDAETGFQYLRARYYDPATAQFLSRDPITAQTRSPYAYTYGNPLNWRDPTGLDVWDDLGGAASDTWHVARAVATAPVSVVTLGVNYGYSVVSGNDVSCHWNSSNAVMVCSGGPTILGAPATTFGGVINTQLSYNDFLQANNCRLMAHETKHTDQWAIFGPLFPGLDAVAAGGDWVGSKISGSDPGTLNPFEIWAGLKDGGYK